MKKTKTLSLITALSAMLILNPLYAKETNSNLNTKITSDEIGSLAAIAAIDKNEILLAIIANHKKTASNIADFAKMMINMHGDNLTHVLEMAETMHVSHLSGNSANKIQDNGAREMLTLGGLQGKEFDKAYVDAMVKGHAAALVLIDKNLMKTAKSEEIKKFLTDTRTVVVQHLDDAKKLQNTLQS